MRQNYLIEAPNCPGRHCRHDKFCVKRYPTPTARTLYQLVIERQHADQSETLLGGILPTVLPTMSTNEDIDPMSTNEDTSSGSAQ